MNLRLFYEIFTHPHNCGGDVGYDRKEEEKEGGTHDGASGGATDVIRLCQGMMQRNTRDTEHVADRVAGQESELRSHHICLYNLCTA